MNKKNRKLIDQHHCLGMITKEECKMILEKMLEAENESGFLISHATVPVQGAVGYLCEYFYLNIVYQKEKGSKVFLLKRLFVKTLPFRNPDLLKVVKSSESLKKESTLYMKLTNELRQLSQKLWCARCYLAKPDLLVLQNIVDSGHKPLKDLSQFLQKQELESVLKALAIMHASSLAFEKRNNVKINEMLPEVSLEAKHDQKAVWFAAGVQAVIAVALKHPLHKTRTLQRFIKKKLPLAYDKLYENIKPSMKYCKVLCHHDVWGGNVFFSKTELYDKNAVLVDFQLARYLPIAVDVILTLSINIKPGERKLIEQDCYKFYYENFSKEMQSLDLNAEDFMTYETFLSSLKDMGLFGALYSCVAATILRVPCDYMQDLKSNHPEEFYNFIYTDRSSEILQLMEDSAQFNNDMTEYVENLMEHILKDVTFRKKRRNRK